MVPKQFKGWTLPGSPVSPDQQPDIAADETFDALSGYFRIFQLKAGHRFSTDDIALAWFALTQSPQPRRILDLGSGIGTVAMVMAHKAVGAQFVTIEAQDVSHRLAKKSAAWNELTARMDQRLGDFRTPGILTEHEVFDLITGSPPYFPEDGGVLPAHAQKLACRFELRGTVADYAQVAARHLAPGGVFACVFPVEPSHQEERTRQAFVESGMKLIRVRKICLKEGEPPLLGLFAGMRAMDLPAHSFLRPWEDPPLVIRRASGEVHPEYQAVKLSIGFPP